MNQKNSSSTSPNDDVYLANISNIVYHATSKQSADKIIEFGFDLDLGGQQTNLRFIKHGVRKIDDEFVIKRETMLEHQAINTLTNYEKNVGYGDCLLRITLKPDVRIANSKKMPAEMHGNRWRSIFAYAKQHGYDGISNEELVFLFGNKKIEKTEIVEEGDLEYAHFKELCIAHVRRYKKKLNTKKLIYQSLEFQKIDLNVRVMVILVSERAKPCSVFGSTIRFDEILKKLDLYFTVKTREKNFLYEITTEKKFYREMTHVSEEQKKPGYKMSAKEWQISNDHNYFADLFGYPRCCSERYTQDFKNRISPRARSNIQFFEYLKQNGKIPEGLSYVIHIPCKTDCNYTIELGLKYKKILDEVDANVSHEYCISNFSLNRWKEMYVKSNFSTIMSSE